jgi:hypothetical protein
MANPTGKGGFGDRPQDINRAGAPKRGQNWQETVKRLSDMTREELIEYVGPKTKIGKLLKELPPGVPMKDALVLISFIQYGRDPNPRLLATLMDREDGKPNQPVSGPDGGALKVIIEYADSQDPTAETSSGTNPNQDRA